MYQAAAGVKRLRMQERFLQKAGKFKRLPRSKLKTLCIELGANYTQYVSTVDEYFPGVTSIF
jgi:hypothetical protein